MSDNIQLNSNSSSGPIIATDEHSGRHFQIVKTAFGSDNVLNLIDIDNPLPVDVKTSTLSTASNQVLINNSLSNLLGQNDSSSPITDSSTSNINGRLIRLSQRITSLIASIGEVQSSPTANTLLDRIKSIHSKLSDYVPITFKDESLTDAFGRFRISDTKTIFDSTQEYSNQSLIFTEYTINGASVTYNQSRNSSTLSTFDSTPNSRALRQTKQYFKYQPGKSQFIKISSVLEYGLAPSGTAVASLGYYDDRNGLFFGQDATGLFVAKRSDISGSVVTEKIYQSDWNIDKLDGTGISGISIDPSKSQLFIIDFQWLSVGTVRFGFQINGKTYFCHKMHHSNIITGAYMRTANLPIRFEVKNDSGTGSVILLEAIACSVESESGLDQSHYSFSVNNGNTSKACLENTITPVLSMRVKDTFNGLKYYGCTHLEELNTMVLTNNCRWYLIWNGTLTGSNFISSNNYSGIEYDISSSAITGGILLESGYFEQGASNKIGKSQSVELINKLILSRTYDNTRDIITLASSGLSGTTNIYSSINYLEDY